jgi:hypothetical protein
MRRLMAAAAVTAALLLTGCSTDKTAAGDASAAPTPAGTAAPAVTGAPGATSATGTARTDGDKAKGDAALSGNTAALCSQAVRTGGQAAAAFAQDLKLLIDAESARNKAAVAEAKAKTTRDVENYEYALKDMSKLAADPAVKQALAEMSASVDRLKGDVRKIDADELGRLQGTLGKACGNG